MIATQENVVTAIVAKDRMTREISHLVQCEVPGHRSQRGNTSTVLNKLSGTGTEVPQE